MTERTCQAMDLLHCPCNGRECRNHDCNGMLAVASRAHAGPSEVLVTCLRRGSRRSSAGARPHQRQSRGPCRAPQRGPSSVWWASASTVLHEQARGTRVGPASLPAPSMDCCEALSSMFAFRSGRSAFPAHDVCSGVGAEVGPVLSAPAGGARAVPMPNVSSMTKSSAAAGPALPGKRSPVLCS